MHQWRGGARRGAKAQLWKAYTIYILCLPLEYMVLLVLYWVGSSCLFWQLDGGGLVNKIVCERL